MVNAGDPFDLQRFVDAQAATFDAALAELRAGRKRTHWMWYVFPQLRGLGFSSTAQQYGIASMAEARAYLAHPILGPRVRVCLDAVLANAERPLSQIFGTPDDLKFRSSMTLFALASAEDDDAFHRAVAICGGADQRTRAILEAGAA